MVVLPLPVTVAGLKLQALSAGKPEQDAVIVLVEPGGAVMASVVCPDKPGLAMRIGDRAAGSRKSGVIVIDKSDALALKLPSPA